MNLKCLNRLILLFVVIAIVSCDTQKRKYNEKYTGDQVSRIAFPIGGLGTGMFCIEGSGAVSNMNIRHRNEMLHEPVMFAGLYLRDIENGSIVIEGQVPDWKKFGQPRSTKGYGGTWGFPRFKDGSFEAKFPFANLDVWDDELKIKVSSHLLSVYKYNLRDNLRKHVNPQRSTFALGDEGGLLLCSWPKGGKLQLPFVYSNEVWTGIEYQVASHLMFQGEIEKGLEIVRTCRDRYDGRVRNPFNEYECGAWYARALSSYAMLEALTGVRYDAVDKILYIDSGVENNFTSFLSTNSGFGNVGLKNGKPFLKVAYGNIDVERCVVSSVSMDLIDFKQ